MLRSTKKPGRTTRTHFETTAPRPQYTDALGLGVPDTPSLIQQVTQGLPYAALERLQRRYALATRDITEVILPLRTLTRRRISGRLTAEESDRVLRVARLMHRATTLFNNDPEAAKAWMTSAHSSFGGAVPLALAKTEVGAREVEDALLRIEDGVFA